MKIIQLIGCLLATICCTGVSAAGHFQTQQDSTLEDSVSGIRLHNASNTDKTVYGLYIRQLAYVTPGNACNTSTPIYNSATNKTVGSVVAPVVIKAGDTATLGKNYLYNMLFQAFYYAQVSSLPTSCSLPGCTWGDDSNIYNWCIYLGALSPVTTTSGYTANIPPSTEDASTGSYNYNLISSYITLGPITCNDETLTCRIADNQTQNFT